MHESLSYALGRQLDKLAAFEPNGFPFTSLYLNTQADQHGRDNFAPFVRKELSSRAKSFTPDSEERASFERDASRIWSYLDNDLRPSANGVAIFANSGADGYFEAIQFDAPIRENKLHVSEGPHLYPLAHLIESHPRYVALVADTDVARLFVFDLGRTSRVAEIDNTGRSLAADGVHTHLRYRRRLEKYNLVHAKEAARMLERVVREERAEHVILAGDEQIIPLLSEQLPAHVADKVVDVLRLDIRTPEHEILKATMEALDGHNIQTDAEKVRDLLDRHSSGGLAVVGAVETLNALARGQVDELLVGVPLEEMRSGEAAAAGRSPGLKGIVAARTETVADGLISRARSTDTAITFIEDAALLADVGGVGGFLRYRRA